MYVSVSVYVGVVLCCVETGTGRQDIWDYQEWPGEGSRVIFIFFRTTQHPGERNTAGGPVPEFECRNGLVQAFFWGGFVWRLKTKPLKPARLI